MTAAKKFFTAMLDGPRPSSRAPRPPQPGAAMPAIGAPRSAHRARRDLAAGHALGGREPVRSRGARGTVGGRPKSPRASGQARIIPRERARHHRGVHPLRAQPRRPGDRRSAPRPPSCVTGPRADPDFAAPAAHHARFCWRIGGPDPRRRRSKAPGGQSPSGLARVYGAIHGGAAPLDRFKRFERSRRRTRCAREPSGAGGGGARRAAVGRARRHLERALSAPAPPSISRP